MSRFTENWNSVLFWVVVLLLFFAYILWPAYPHFLSIVRFGDVSLKIELATTTAAQELGLGGRKTIPPDYGLLFVFQNPDYYGIWMKDMRIPIDIFWLDSQGQVITMDEHVATSTYPNVFYPASPARYVLETASGFAEANHIITGTALELKNIQGISQ